MQIAGMEDIWSAIGQGANALVNVGTQYQQYKIQEAQAKALRTVAQQNPLMSTPTLVTGAGYVPTQSVSLWSGNTPIIALGIGAAVAIYLATRGRRGR